MSSSMAEDTLAIELGCVLEEAATQVTVSVVGPGLQVPQSLEMGASVDLVASKIESLEHGQWVALRDQDRLLLAAGSGSTFEVDVREAVPTQDLWAPLVMSYATSECEVTTAACNDMTQRGRIRFTGLGAEAIEVFDHALSVEGGYSIAVGDALPGIGESTCDGATGSWFDFVVLSST